MGAERSALHASNIAAAPNVASAAPEVGKQTLPQGYQLGDDYIDNGLACEVGDGPGCLWAKDDRQRERLLTTITRLVLNAQRNYKDAILELKIGELLKKEEDLSWVALLAIDLLTAHLSTVVSTALKAVQAKGVSRLNELGLRAATMLGEDPGTWHRRAEAAIAMATPTRIDTVIKAGFAFGGIKVKAAGKEGANAATQTAKTATIAYLNQLRDQCDIAFDGFMRQVSGSMTDVELVATHDGFAPEFHSTGAYIESLSGKLDRFRKSGALDIGRGVVKADDYGGEKLRDTRVVYVQDINGHKAPWYQKQDGADIGSGYVAPGDPAYDKIDSTDPKHKAKWSTFGARSEGTAVLDRPVPEEFRDVAIAASEARWGATLTVDDGYVALLKQQGVNVDEMRTRVRGGVMVSKTFPPDRTPWDTRLPSGSIFEEKK